jgi:hypothetical protein
VRGAEVKYLKGDKRKRVNKGKRDKMWRVKKQDEEMKLKTTRKYVIK